MYRCFIVCVHLWFARQMLFRILVKSSRILILQTSTFLILFSVFFLLVFYTLHPSPSKAFLYVKIRQKPKLKNYGQMVAGPLNTEHSNKFIMKRTVQTGHDKSTRWRKWRSEGKAVGLRLPEGEDQGPLIPAGRCGRRSPQGCPRCIAATTPSAWHTGAPVRGWVGRELRVPRLELVLPACGLRTGPW